MKVILQEPIDNLGDIGSVVDVKPGYGRYLLASDKALRANEDNMKVLEAKRKELEKVIAERVGEAEKLAKAIEKVELRFLANVSELSSGKIYGSIGPVEVGELLHSHDIELSKAVIAMSESIKQLGTYEVMFKLHPKVVLTRPLIVEAAGGDDQDAVVAQAMEGLEEEIEERQAPVQAKEAVEEEVNEPQAVEEEVNGSQERDQEEE